jgi:hypothetical protein
VSLFIAWKAAWIILAASTVPRHGLGAWLLWELIKAAMLSGWPLSVC